MLLNYDIIPHALIVDANILLNLLSPEIYSDEQFFTLVLGSRFFGEVLIPQQALDEWNYLKDKTTEIHQANIQKNAQEITKLIKKFPIVLGKAETKQAIDDLHKTTKRSYEYTYGSRKIQLDKFLRENATIIETRSSILDSIVIDLAIKSFVPFFANENGHAKNEATDALIFFGVVEYFKKNRKNYHKVVFVSSNKEEFAEKGNETKLHQNLKSYFEDLNIHFTSNLNLAYTYLELDEKQKELGKIIAESNKDRENFLSDEYFVPCQNEGCNNEVHVNADTIIVRQEYYYECRKCKFSWPTGDSILVNYY